MSDEAAHAVFQAKGPLALVTLDRPDALNAVTPRMLAEIDAALDRAEADPAIAAIAFKGAGKAFCAGADLIHVEGALGGDTGPAMSFLREAHRVFGRIETCPKPTIAMINGLAVAAGMELTLCCDLVYAAAGAKLGDAHANFGLLPGGGGSFRLPRRIGLNRAKELLFTGDFWPVEDFVVCGLVNKVLPRDALEAHVLDLAAKLAGKSALVLRRMKQLANAGLEQPTRSAIDAELATFEAHLSSADLKEGLTAFKEKRRPVFTGR